MAFVIPELTRRRVAFHAGLVVIALLEFVSRMTAISVFPSKELAAFVGWFWILIVFLPGDLPRLQPFAVELVVLAFVELSISLLVVSLLDVGPHYFVTAHPVGVMLAALWTVSVVPAIGLSIGTLLQEGGEWFVEWRRIRGTTPEERVLEGEP